MKCDPSATSQGLVTSILKLLRAGWEKRHSQDKFFIVVFQTHMYIFNKALRGERHRNKNATDLEEEQPRRVPQAYCARAGDDDEDVADAVASVVEELSHRTGCPRSAGLTKG